MFDFKLPNISIEQDLELNSDVLKRIPKYHRYLLISPQDCYTFPHIDHEGTAIFNYQLIWLIGSPDVDSYEFYEKWYSEMDEIDIMDQDHADKFEQLLKIGNFTKVISKAGQTVVFTGGHIHAVITTRDSVCLGGAFFRIHDIEVITRIVAMDENLGIPLDESLKRILGRFFSKAQKFDLIDLWHLHMLLSPLYENEYLNSFSSFVTLKAILQVQDFTYENDSNALASWSPFHKLVVQVEHVDSDSNMEIDESPIPASVSPRPAPRSPLPLPEHEENPVTIPTSTSALASTEPALSNSSSAGPVDSSLYPSSSTYIINPYLSTINYMDPYSGYMNFPGKFIFYH
uniref:JmjC domain-containing protein n=1 Tax=Acrobeloides nanus TaxID=290746 RepID=A0A914CXC2_9BILA